MSVCFSSLQLLRTLWNMCFLCGEASKPSGESLTRYDTYTPHIYTYAHPHTEKDTKSYYAIKQSFFSLSLPASQIIKKSCIEILAAEPSSVCAGGKRCQEQGFPSSLRRWAVNGVWLCHDSHLKPLEWNMRLSNRTDAYDRGVTESVLSFTAGGN